MENRQLQMVDCMYKNGEIEKVMDAFERLARTIASPLPALRLDRCKRGIGETFGQNFYENGETNKFFHAFLMGYSFGKVQ